MLRVLLMILIGLLSINANAEHDTTTEIDSENSTATLLNESISTKESDNDDNPNTYPVPTTESVSKIIHIQRAESIHEKSSKVTRRSNSGDDLLSDSKLEQDTEFQKDVDGKSKDSDPVDSNTTSVVATKISDSEVDDTANIRSFDSGTDSETKNSNYNSTDNSQYTTNTDIEIENKSNNNDSESNNTLSEPNLELNTKKSQIYKRNLTENVTPLETEDNHNGTESTTVRNTDDDNSNTGASNESEILVPHLEPNTEKSKVFRRSHTENDHKPFNNEENHNDTDYKINRVADDHNSNTEVSKESIILDPHLELNTEHFQVNRRNHESEKVFKPLNDEENHNGTDYKINRVAVNHNSNTEASNESKTLDLHPEPNTEKSQAYRSHINDHNSNTEASKESKINIVNEGQHQSDSSKQDGNTQESVNNDKTRSNKSEALSLDVSDSKELIGNKKDVYTMNTRRSLNFNDDSDNFNETNLNYHDSNNFNEINTETTPTEEDYNYDLVRRDGFTRRNLNYEALSNESTANQAKPSDKEENDSFFGLTRRNLNQGYDLDDYRIGNIIKPIETETDSEDVETVLSRSGRPDGGYISEPYDGSREPKLIKPPSDADFRSKNLNTCCRAISSPQHHDIKNSFMIHPVYGKIPLLYNSRNGLGKPMEIIPNVHFNGNEHSHHLKFPSIRFLHVSRASLPQQNYGSPDALNIFQNSANTIINPDAFENHGNKIANPENQGIVFANKKYPLTNHETPLANHEMPLANLENKYVKYENLPKNYENPQLNFENSHRNYDPLTSYINPLENHENPLTSHGNNYAKHGNSFKSHENNYAKHENPPMYYENPQRSYDPFTSHRNPPAYQENPLVNHDHPLGSHGNNYENLPANYGNPYLNYENPRSNHDALPYHENPLANHKKTLKWHDPLTNHGNPSANHENYLANQPDYDPFYKHFRPTRDNAEIDEDNNVYPRARDATDTSHQAKHEHITTNPENPQNILGSHDPPLSSHHSRAIHGNPSASNGYNNYAIHEQNLANQPDYTPFYNNFRHHSSDEEVDDGLYPRTIVVNRTSEPHKAPVPSSQANRKLSPYEETVLRFPIKSVPFWKFFL